MELSLVNEKHQVWAFPRCVQKGETITTHADQQ